MQINVNEIVQGLNAQLAAKTLDLIVAQIRIKALEAEVERLTQEEE